MKEKQFIFAKFGVEIRNHDKMVAAIAEAGWGALGVYGWATMDLRAKESDDGVIPALTLLQAHGRQKDTQKIINALVRVGLFVAHNSGYYVDKYEEYNDTRSEIEAKRAKDRQRKRPNPDVPPSGILTESEGKGVEIPYSLSNSISKPLSLSRVPSGVSGTMTSLTADAALSDSDRAAAEMMAIQNVDDVWIRFRNWQRSNHRVSGDWSLTWQNWCIDERNKQTKERERDRKFNRPKGRAVQELDGTTDWEKEAKVNLG